MTHPLTKEMCEALSRHGWLGFDSDPKGLIHDMRAAYDKGAADTLERVSKLLKATESTVKLCPSILAVQLEQAMRPPHRRTTMTDLSPAAQAVLTAFGKHPVHSDYIVNDLIHGALPAAIEAAVDQVTCKVLTPCTDFDEYAQGYLAANIKCRSKLLAIAAELRSDTTQEDN